MARPLSAISAAAYWLMDSIIYDLEALEAARNGDRAKEVRCILMANSVKKLALEKIEGLSVRPKPSE